MLTVHILPPTHELIAARDEAVAADASLIEEVMVIIDRGGHVRTSAASPGGAGAAPGAATRLPPAAVQTSDRCVDIASGTAGSPVLSRSGETHDTESTNPR